MITRGINSRIGRDMSILSVGVIGGSGGAVSTFDSLPSGVLGALTSSTWNPLSSGFVEPIDRDTLTDVQPVTDDPWAEVTDYSGEEWLRIVMGTGHYYNPTDGLISGGASLTDPEPFFGGGAQEVELSFRLHIEAGFEVDAGLKIGAGLFAGAQNTGGGQNGTAYGIADTRALGWSARFMLQPPGKSLKDLDGNDWTSGGTTNQLCGYFYTAEREDAGYGIGINHPLATDIAYGVDIPMKLHVRVNDRGASNGFIKITVNGVSALNRTGIEIVKDDVYTLAQSVHAGAFRGGNDISWAGSQTDAVRIIIDDVTYTAPTIATPAALPASPAATFLTSDLGVAGTFLGSARMYGTGSGDTGPFLDPNGDIPIIEDAYGDLAIEMNDRRLDLKGFVPTDSMLQTYAFCINTQAPVINEGNPTLLLMTSSSGGSNFVVQIRNSGSFRTDFGTISDLDGMEGRLRGSRAVVHIVIDSGADEIRYYIDGVPVPMLATAYGSVDITGETAIGTIGNIRLLTGSAETLFYGARVHDAALTDGQVATDVTEMRTLMGWEYP